MKYRNSRLVVFLAWEKITALCFREKTSMLTRLSKQRRHFLKYATALLSNSTKRSLVFLDVTP
jgi:hypothetical protein